MSMQTDRRYWFPAKRYGWGWGFPSSWEGWLALAAFFALLAAGFFLFPPGDEMISFIAFVIVIAALFVAVCWLKGEPPRWRWGKD
jgi:hypothetical protein